MGTIDTQPIQIVELSIKKWQDYRDLRLQALKESPQAFSTRYEDQIDRPEEYWRNRLEEAMKGDSSWLLFARSGDRLVGMVGAFRDPSNGVEADLISMYVTPEARGRGIASLLMHAVLMVLKDSGICRARLEVNLDQSAAVHIYRKFGFEIISVNREMMGDGTEHDLAIMEKIFDQL